MVRKYLIKISEEIKFFLNKRALSLSVLFFFLFFSFLFLRIKCIILNRGVHANRRPVGTDQPDRNRPVMFGLTPSTGRWRVSNHQNQLRRVEWRVSSSRNRATRLARQKLKERRKSPWSGDDLTLLSSDSATFGLPSLRLAQIWPRSSLFLT